MKYVINVSLSIFVWYLDIAALLRHSHTKTIPPHVYIQHSSCILLFKQTFCTFV